MKKDLRRALVCFLGPLALLSCATSGFLGWRQAWQAPHPVAIKGGTGESMWYNVMPSWATWTTTIQDGGTGGLLVRDGDIVAGISGSGTSYCIVYRQGDGDSLEIHDEDGRLTLSGKTISINSADSERCWEWLETASPNDLRSLRFLVLPQDLDESLLPTLGKLAAENPGLCLEVGSASGSLRAAALFKPRTLVLDLSATAAELGGFFEGQHQIETLWTSVTEAESLPVLATLPNLRRLIIEDWDPAKSGPLPAGMHSLRSLLLPGSEMLDTSALAAVPDEIEELSLVACGNLKSLSGLERFSNLRTLILNLSDGIEDLSALRGMKKLAWVGLPPGITQEQFSALVVHVNV